MKSTLPALFRTKVKETGQKQQQITSRILDISPEKQIPYFNLDLYVNQNHNQYRTKIINTHHQKSTNEEKLPPSTKIKFKQRYGEYPGRSLSVQGGYHLINQNRSISYTNDFDHSSKMYSTLDFNKSTSLYKSNKTPSIHNLQQSDNVKINIKKISHEIVLLKKSLQDVPPLHKTFLEQLSRSRETLFEQIQDLEMQVKQKTNILWQNLSILRRQTNMELKTLKREVQLVRQEINQQKDLISDIEDQRAIIKRVNF